MRALRWVLAALIGVGVDLTTPLAAQVRASASTDTALGAGEGRAFYFRQHSVWVADGQDPAFGLVGDSGVMLSPVEPGALRSSTFTAALAPLEYGPGVNATFFRDNSLRFSRVELDGYAPDMMAEEAGSAFHEIGHWFSRIRLVGRRWVDTVAYSHVMSAPDRDPDLATLPDTAWVRRERSGVVLEKVKRGGRVWLRLQSNTRVRLVVTKARDFSEDPLEPRRVTEVEGVLKERFLYDSTNLVVDSVVSSGQLRGMVTFTNARAPADTVRGTFTVERTGNWARDHRAELLARESFFIEHGHDTTARSAREKRPYWEYSQRLLRGDSTAVDDLLALRAKATSASDRAAIDGALTWTYDVQAYAMRRFTTAYRRGDGFLLNKLLELRSNDTLDVGHAIAFVDGFRTLRRQRQVFNDRDDALMRLQGAVMEAAHVTGAAGQMLAEAAATPNAEPAARDAFLIGAYRSDPARYRALLERLVSRTGRFEPVALAYVNLDLRSLYPTFTSGGRQDSIPLPFPAADAPWSKHAAYHRALGDWEFGPQTTLFTSRLSATRLREWIAGHDSTAAGTFRRNFVRDTVPSAKAVWAGYLLLLNDTLPLPWLREMAAAAGDSSRSLAHLVLEVNPRFVEDTLRSGPVLADIQDRLLRHAINGLGFADSVQGHSSGFITHNERPDLQLLDTTGIEPSVLAQPRWREYFAYVDRAELERRAKREGLVMAYVISPVRRVLDRYHVAVSHLPFTDTGGGCLCGGGSVLVVTQRDGKWIVVQNWGWVS